MKVVSCLFCLCVCLSRRSYAVGCSHVAAARFLIDHGADPANLTTVIPQRVMLAMGDVFGDGAESMLDASFDADEVAAMIEPYAGNNPSKPVWSGPIADEYASAVRFTEEVRTARIGMIRSWGWSGLSAGGWGGLCGAYTWGDLVSLRVVGVGCAVLTHEVI